MKTLIFIAVLAFLALVVMTALGKKKVSNEQPTKKRLLTPREAEMFVRLRAALPEVNVYVQVSFGALLDAKSRACRNTFDRKMADYVLCDSSQVVLAVVELDDASHRHKMRADQDRDRMLVAAGYRVLRYPNIPGVERLRSDVFPPPATGS